ncbi:MAG: hypothetical protein IPH57_10865 [Saprospiraceae bacterium]|nr:hypothetical protein [Saprospiraceae bacterium]
MNLDSVEINNEIYYRISHVDSMRPFLMSIVSDSNHWLFISSNGGLTAGRRNSEYSLFPYYTDDKITESSEITGSKTIISVTKNNAVFLWEPFSVRSEGRFRLSRNLYQNKLCNKILFEEINHDLQLCFQYEWSCSNLYGFVRQSKLINLSGEIVELQLVDGIQNIMPYGLPTDLQTTTSNLADAYKRSELIPQTGVAIYALSAIIVDKAEPAEALKANVAWSAGLDKPTYLLSSNQLQHFRNNKSIQQEEDVKGEKGAYILVSTLKIAAGVEKKWMIVANVNQNQAAVIALSEQIKNDKEFSYKVLADVAAGTLHLQELTGSADGFQYTADILKDTRHYSNVLFNIMRGGIFDNNYQIEKWDFNNYLKKANNKVFEEAQTVLTQLREIFSLFDLKKIAGQFNNPDFLRLATEYLPLKFSRRHGDPSRPWNQFSINTRSEIDGSKILDYQGNWRDIFQNWEALAHSYPEFIDGMISKFLNASTFDGYNPYRVTKDGFDWETIEPDNPWSYIGYWGDHQIVYLLKFLEFAEQHQAGAIEKMLELNNFVYANVPYRIKSYQYIVNNPKDTIEFDHHNEKIIKEQIKQKGADGALLTVNGIIYRVNFAEKILATILSKLSNFVPEGGIWMNTQRPEWNDANNALVGNGVSMVTLYYLRRFLKLFLHVVENAKSESVSISAELHLLFTQLSNVFSSHSGLLNSSIDTKIRKAITDALGIAGSNFRNKIYDNGFSGKKENLTTADLAAFVKSSLQFVEHSINANKRKDKLYHAYNLLSFENDELKISYLSEMLEGQVAVLSSEQLTPTESLQLLDALKQSSLYRKDQNSYILYPNKNLKGFLERNNIPAVSVGESQLLQKLVADNNVQIIEKDIKGGFHFNGNFINSGDLDAALDNLTEKEYKTLAATEKRWILKIFEDVFNHKEFTGRSGTFYAFEGLGSIYWHMVSKLSLAVQETCLRAIKENADIETIDRLVKHYYDVNDGIGVHKSPQVYGAFSFTPYSHTPLHKGAQQPGMTGQVKEDILTRIGELGVKMKDGKLVFEPHLLSKSEFLQKETNATFFLADGRLKNVLLEPNSLAFTVCQVPVIYKSAKSNKIEVYYINGAQESFSTSELNEQISSKISQRTGEIDHIKVYLNENNLRK